jgi:hypothetical protein
VWKKIIEAWIERKVSFLSFRKLKPILSNIGTARGEQIQIKKEN